MSTIRAVAVSIVVGLVVFVAASWIAGWEPQYGFLIFFSIVAAIVDYLTGIGARMRSKKNSNTPTGQ